MRTRYVEIQLPNAREYFERLLTYDTLSTAEREKLTEDGQLLERDTQQDQLSVAEYRRNGHLVIELENRLKEIAPPVEPNDGGPLSQERRQNPNAKLILGWGWVLPLDDSFVGERAIVTRRLQLARAQVKKYEKVFEEAGRDFFKTIMGQSKAVVAR